MLQSLIALRDAFLALLLSLAGVDYANAPQSEAEPAEREVFRVALGPDGRGVTIAFGADEAEEGAGVLDAPAWPQPRLPRLRLLD
jgi:hypothetical protein